MKKETLKDPILAEEIVKIICSSHSIDEMRERMRDYHGNDFAAVLTYYGPAWVMLIRVLAMGERTKYSETRKSSAIWQSFPSVVHTGASLHRNPPFHLLIRVHSPQERNNLRSGAAVVRPEQAAADAVGNAVLYRPPDGLCVVRIRRNISERRRTGSRSLRSAEQER